MASKSAVASGAPATRWVVRGSRAAHEVAFEEALVALFVDAADLLGVPKSVAAIYGLVFASSEPPSFSEIAERLSISSGSVSQGLRILREMGAIRVAENGNTVEGRGRDRFEPDLEMRQLMRRFIEQRLETQLAHSGQQLDTLDELAGAFPASDREILDKRLGTIQRWHRRARGLAPVIKAFLKIPGPT